MKRIVKAAALLMAAVLLLLSMPLAASADRLYIIEDSNTRKLTYEEAYENGLLLSYAWVKQGKCYTHTARISRPLPDKKLKLQWTTFRDRLKPGQQEEWTLTVLDLQGKPVDAQLMATLYDQSLDQLQAHQWSLSPYYNLPMPNSNWGFPTRYSMSGSASYSWKHDAVGQLVFSKFDKDVYPSPYYRHHYFTRGEVMGARQKMAASVMMVEEAAMPMSEPMERDADQSESADAKANGAVAEAPQEESVQVRENLNETAFFYPQLTTAADGSVALKFTLPESLTTWRLLGLAHTKDLCYGTIEGLSVAQKDVMIQPNVPRFLREGDAATIAARIFNTSEKDLSGTAVLKLINPETNAVVVELKQPVAMKAGGTTPVTFDLDTSSLLAAQSSLLICQMMVSGADFSDGEQHYLPILPATEHITVTVPVTHYPAQAHGGIYQYSCLANDAGSVCGGHARQRQCHLSGRCLLCQCPRSSYPPAEPAGQDRVPTLETDRRYHLAHQCLGEESGVEGPVAQRDPLGTRCRQRDRTETAHGRLLR